MRFFRTQNGLSSRLFFATLGLLLLAFSCFMMQSSGNLYLETLRGISGPLDSTQYSALRLSHLLDITGVLIFGGAVCTLLYSVFSSGLCRTHGSCDNA